MPRGRWIPAFAGMTEKRVSSEAGLKKYDIIAIKIKV
jgi:hypothetical protein